MIPKGINKVHSFIYFLFIFGKVTEEKCEKIKLQYVEKKTNCFCFLIVEAVNSNSG